MILPNWVPATVQNLRKKLKLYLFAIASILLVWRLYRTNVISRTAAYLIQTRLAKFFMRVIFNYKY